MDQLTPGQMLREIKDLAQLIDSEATILLGAIKNDGYVQQHVVERVLTALRQELDNLRRA